MVVGKRPTTAFFVSYQGRGWRCRPPILSPDHLVMRRRKQRGMMAPTKPGDLPWPGISPPVCPQAGRPFFFRYKRLGWRDRCHVRQALTVEEVGRLLDATKKRPVAELGRKPQRVPEDPRSGRSFLPATAEKKEATD